MRMKEKEGRREGKEIYMKKRRFHRLCVLVLSGIYGYFQHLCRLPSRLRVIVRDHKYTSQQELEVKLVVGGMKNWMGFGSITSCYARRDR